MKKMNDPQKILRCGIEMTRRRTARVPAKAPMPADVFNADTHANLTGSAQDKYYNYMLMKERMTAYAEQSGQPEIKDLINVNSELEVIVYETFKQIAHISESSPEFAQIVTVTGTEDRYQQARRLAEMKYKKIKAARLLDAYTPSTDFLEKNFYEKALQSSKVRIDKLSAGKDRVDKSNTVSGAIAAAARAFTGAGAGASSS